MLDRIVSGTSKFTRGNWIVSPWLDATFIFSFLWVVPVLLFFSNSVEAEAVAILLPFTILLSQGHKYSPHILLLFSPKVRAHVLAQRPRVFLEVTLLILIPVLFGAGAAYLLGSSSFPNNFSKSFFIPISFIALIYTVWTFFHFSQQNYGIVKIYRMKNTKARDITLDRFEHITVTFTVFCLTALICVFSNERMGFYLFFFEPLQMPEYLRASCTALCIFLYIGSLVYYFKRSVLNLPVALGITHFFAITVVVCTLPLYLGLLLTSISHWTQAIFLASYQLKEDSRLSFGSSRARLLAFVCLFLAMSSVLYVGYNWINRVLPVVGNFGDAKNFALYDRELVLLGLVYFSLNVGLNYSHFYLDRFIYRGNRLLR